MDSDQNSPCNGKCFLDPKTLKCVGCYRTSEEIANWSNYSSDQKNYIIKNLEFRKLKQ
ncbi:MAG: DUF1289 domain-containing protein [Thermodesulfobacteriota bacterium]